MSAAKKFSTAKRPSTRKAGARGRDVVLERIESQMQFVVEAVTGLREELVAKIDDLEARLSARISVLEEVVRQNSLDIKKNSEDIKKNSEDIRRNSEDIKKNSEDIRRNSEDIRVLREEVAQLRRDFEHRAELARMSALEERVARVEQKLGIAS
jgi:chromosome segregation ATPase